MQCDGIIRRIGAVPNHYKLGFKGNGMSVWDVPDDQRTRARSAYRCDGLRQPLLSPPAPSAAWPYNLFAMVHGRDRAEVLMQVARIAELLGDAVRGHDVLFSTRILKKTGLRLLAE